MEIPLRHLFRRKGGRRRKAAAGQHGALPNMLEIIGGIYFNQWIRGAAEQAEIQLKTQGRIK